MNATGQRIEAPERRRLLESAIQAQVATGGRVKSERDFEALVVRRVRPRRLRHLLLSLFTVFRGVAWLVDEISLLQSKKRQLVSVDEFGLVTIEPADEKAAAAVSRALEGPQVAGTFVSQKGTTRRTVAKEATGFAGGVAGFAAGLAEWIGKTLGLAAGEAATEVASERRARKKREGSVPFRLPSGGYLVVGVEDVVVVIVHFGLRRGRIGPEVAARAARSAVVSAELHRRPWPGELTIGFADGKRWEFEVPRIYRDTTEQVVEALTVGATR
jgi:hypothetical protein